MEVIYKKVKQMIGNPNELIVKLLELDKEKRYEIKEYKEKRSLSQNAYCWSLINKIANIMKLSKEDLYFKYLQEYGQSTMVSLKAEINVDGYLKYYKEVGSSDLNGTEFKHYKIYKGSSEYDSKEMSIFVDGIVQEAKDLGIEVRTPDEIRKMELI